MCCPTGDLQGQGGAVSEFSMARGIRWNKPEIIMEYSWNIHMDDFRRPKVVSLSWIFMDFL